jgi:Flp pilus assembly protein TadB
MSLMTVFLGVLAFALVLGNLFLSLIEPKEENEETMKKIEELEKPFSKETTIDKKAFHRSLAFEAKINKLDNFRANTEIELKAIKEILMELQNKGMTVKARTYKKKKKKDNLTAEKMHKIIYRSKKSN